MDLDLERRAAAAFDQVFGLSGESLASALDQECGQDPALRARVEELLRAAEREAFFLDGSFATPGDLETPPLGGAEERGGESADALPARIGDCDILGVLGTGGMGIVYEGRQDQPRRPVAIKVVRAPGVTRAGLARFRQEAELLGRLDHPGIAKVFGVGTHNTPAGDFPFLVMELIPGAKPITRHAHSRRLSSHQRLEMLAAACDAVQAAHTALIVHRDLKPANILVGADGRVRVIDFGIAKSLSPDAGLPTIPTEGSRVVGTVHYMSPELLTQGAIAASTQSDVFSLGVSMYELLLGTRPFGDDQTTMFEVMRRITTATAPPDSKAFRGLNPDLRTILAKAIAPDPRHRYATARDLADDIRNFLTHRPIAARPQSRTYLAAMFVRRHRVATVLSTLAVMALITLTVISVAAGVGEKNARILADERAVAASKELYRALMGSAARAIEDGDTASAVKQLGLAPREWRGREHALLSAMVSTAHRVADTENPIDTLALDPRGAVRLAGRFGTGIWDEQGVEFNQAIEFPSGGPPPRLIHHSTNPELKIVVHEAPSITQPARLVIERAGQPTRTMNPTVSRVTASAIDPSRKFVAISDPATTRHGRTVVIDTLRGEVTASIDLSGAIAFSHDGSTLWIAGSVLTRLVVAPMTSHTAMTPDEDAFFESISLSADDRRLVLRSRLSLHVIDTATLTEVRRVPMRGGGPVAIDESGQWIAAADGQIVRLIEIETGLDVGRLRSPVSPVVAVACSSRTDRVVAADGYGRVFAWNTVLSRTQAYRSATAPSGMSPDGSAMWATVTDTDEGNGLRIFQATDPGEARAVPTDKPSRLAALGHGGEWVVWTVGDDRLHILRHGGERDSYAIDGVAVFDRLAAFGRDEPLIACSGSAWDRGPSWWIIRAADGEPVGAARRVEGLISLRSLPDGGLLALFGDRAEVYDASGALARVFSGIRPLYDASLTGDGSKIAMMFGDGTIDMVSTDGVSLWRLNTGWSAIDVQRMALDGESRVCLVRSDGRLGVWDPDFGDEPIFTISLLETDEGAQLVEITPEGGVMITVARGGVRWVGLGPAGAPMALP